MMGMVYAVCRRGGRLSAGGPNRWTRPAPGPPAFMGCMGWGLTRSIPGPYLGVEGEEAGGAGALVRRLEDGVAILVIAGADGGGIEAAREVPLLLGERAGDLELLIDDLVGGGRGDGQHPAPPPPRTGCRSQHCTKREGVPAGSPLWGTLRRQCPTAMLAPWLAPARVGRGAERGSGTWRGHVHGSPPLAPSPFPSPQHSAPSAQNNPAV